MLLTELLSSKIKELEGILASVNKELETAPEGYIIRAMKVHKSSQYFFSKSRNNRNGTYLTRKQMPLVKSILQRDYNKKISREIKKQLKALKKLQTIYSPAKLESILEKTTPLRRFGVTPLFTPSSQFAATWKAQNFTPKAFTEETPFLITANGEKVRSKSENLIADTMFHLNIPYRYEAPLTLGNKVFYPDFYCLNVRTRQEFIWEHFGLMEDSEYAVNAVGKLKVYNRFGYFLGKNLIITSETQKNPLFSQEVEKIVKEYLI